jgi:hypothetical protein
MSIGRKVRYVLEDGAPFALHGEGLTIQAITRKSEIPVMVEIEGLSRKRLLQFQAAIEQELERREASWKHHQEVFFRQGHEETETRKNGEAQPA